MHARRVRFTVWGTMAALAVEVTLLPVAAVFAWPPSAQQVRLRALIRDYNAKAVHHAQLERHFSRLAKYSGWHSNVVRRRCRG